MNQTEETVNLTSMPDRISVRQLVSFFFGTYVSSIGSLLFAIALPAFLSAESWPLWKISLIIGTHRLSSLLIGILFTVRVDTIDARKSILWTEILSALTSFTVLMAWFARSEPWGFSVLLFAVTARSMVSAFQSPSRSRLTRLLSVDKAHAKTLAVILNKMTYGAFIIAALIAIPIVKFLSFEWVIVIDGITFLVGGLLVMILPDFGPTGHSKADGHNPILSIFEYVRFDRYLVYGDVALAVAVSGSSMLIVRLAGVHSEVIPTFNLLFGTSVWIGSLLAYRSFSTSDYKLIWFIMAFGLTALSLQESSSRWVFVTYLTCYSAYWVLFHRFTGSFQSEVPVENVGKLMGARSFCINMILGFGELCSGKVATLLSLPHELVVRALICVFGIYLASARGRKMEFSK